MMIQSVTAVIKIVADPDQTVIDVSTQGRGGLSADRQIACFYLSCTFEEEGEGHIQTIERDGPVMPAPRRSLRDGMRTVNDALLVSEVVAAVGISDLVIQLVERIGDSLLELGGVARIE